MILDTIKRNMNRDSELANYACKNEDAIRLNLEDEDFRPSFFRDVDRILYSLSYMRYVDKTQVFTNINNDNISKRMTHVQMVSKIARTIGRALKLNEDLIEASALGHDLGHVPFGHAGEKILNEISIKNNEGYFNHNIQSVRDLLYIENNGVGCNLTIQVIDAIMCHNGEIESKMYKPVDKDATEVLQEYNDSYKSNNCSKLIPMTLEGCVVRISDIISYIGKDIEDAMRLGLLKKEDIPNDILQKIGFKNKDFINTFVNDIIINSYGKNYITMSDENFSLLKEIKTFNYKYIYSKVNSLETLNKWHNMFEKLFSYYLQAIKNKDYNCAIYTVFLNNMTSKYLEQTSNAIKVIDFMAGMTDDYLIREYNKIDNLDILVNN